MLNDISARLDSSVSDVVAFYVIYEVFVQFFWRIPCTNMFVQGNSRFWWRKSHLLNEFLSFSARLLP